MFDHILKQCEYSIASFKNVCVSICVLVSALEQAHRTISLQLLFYALRVGWSKALPVWNKPAVVSGPVLIRHIWSHPLYELSHLSEVVLQYHDHLIIN